jgi:hypothetical protein
LIKKIPERGGGGGGGGLVGLKCYLKNKKGTLVFVSKKDGENYVKRSNNVGVCVHKVAS